MSDKNIFTHILGRIVKSDGNREFVIEFDEPYTNDDIEVYDDFDGFSCCVNENTGNYLMFTVKRIDNNEDIVTTNMDFYDSFIPEFSSNKVVINSSTNCSLKKLKKQFKKCYKENKINEFRLYDYDKDRSKLRIYEYEITNYEDGVITILDLSDLEKTTIDLGGK